MGSYKQKTKSFHFSFIISNGFNHQTNFGWCLLPKFVFGFLEEEENKEGASLVHRRCYSRTL